MTRYHKNRPRPGGIDWAARKIRHMLDLEELEAQEQQHLRARGWRPTAAPGVQPSGKAQFDDGRDAVANLVQAELDAQEALRNEARRRVERRLYAQQQTSTSPSPEASEGVRASSSGYHENINPELGGSRHRAAHLTHAGGMDAPAAFGDVYDQSTPYGRIAQNIYTNSGTQLIPWLVRESTGAPETTNDAIGIMLTELYRQHLAKFGSPPDWETLKRHHRTAYSQFGVDPDTWAAKYFPDGLGPWLAAPNSLLD
jgi:hypothetical protein